jgi:hypothetical protein
MCPIDPVVVVNAIIGSKPEVAVQVFGHTPEASTFHFRKLPPSPGFQHRIELDRLVGRNRLEW